MFFFKAGIVLHDFHIFPFGGPLCFFMSLQIFSCYGVRCGVVFYSLFFTLVFVYLNRWHLLCVMILVSLPFEVTVVL